MAAPTEPTSAEPKSAAEELVDMVFFAPLGLALECLDRFPDLVARGRKQTRFAQSLGKMALGGLARKQPPASPPSRRAAAPPPDKAAPDDKPAAAAQSTETAKPAAKPVTKAKSASKTKATAKPKSTTTPASKAKPAAKPPEDVAAMNARDAIAWIRTVPTDQLAEVEAAERAGKGRVTVLRAIEQAASGS